MANLKISVPPIKCQGIKTKLVPWIRSAMPHDFSGTWIEPFLGSGVVAFNIRPERAILSDTNPHLISFYRSLYDGRITATIARRFLESEGEKLARSDGEYYYTVRDRFNESRDPMDFLFLNRSCFNGMIRFNKKGGFNVPFCRKPNRFAPALVTKITNQIQAISNILNTGEYEFHTRSFQETVAVAAEGDFVYCDPPYIGRHVDYFNGWDEAQEKLLAEKLSSLPCRFMLSTWHHNDFRKNSFIDSLWFRYHILTRDHFYHVGGREENRNPMVEALVTNFETMSVDPVQEKDDRSRLPEFQASWN